VVLRLAILVAVAAVSLVPASVEAADSITLIVHPRVTGARIPRAVVAQIFLRQVQAWGDGSAITPVDRSLTSDTRLAFAHDVLEMSALELRQYWTREVTRGTTPPPVKDSDEQVVAFVAATPGAIGYVAAGTTLPGTVKVLQID